MSDTTQDGIIEERHSVTFKVNAKGQLSAECKCYGLTPEDAITKASGLLKTIEVMIRERNEPK